jgi:hypothetical protein
VREYVNVMYNATLPPYNRDSRDYEDDRRDSKRRKLDTEDGEVKNDEEDEHSEEYFQGIYLLHLGPEHDLTNIRILIHVFSLFSYR